jgi:hypothetical protein
MSPLLEPPANGKVGANDKRHHDAAGRLPRDRWFESFSLQQRVSNEPRRANWVINSAVAEEDCYLLANARASWLTAS